jgi:hypothetical protein
MSGSFKGAAISVLAFAVAFASTEGLARADIQASDTYFNRFLTDAIVQGTSPTKFSVAYLSGTDLGAVAVGGEFAASVRRELDDVNDELKSLDERRAKLSASAPRNADGSASAADTEALRELGFQIKQLEDRKKYLETSRGAIDNEPTRFWLGHDIAFLGYRMPKKPFPNDDARALNLSYGLAARNIPFVGSVYGGVYYSYASALSGDPVDPLKERHQFAPYLYLDSPPTIGMRALGPVRYRFFALPNGNFDSLRKLVADVGLSTDKLTAGLWYERTLLATGTLNEFSAFGRLAFSDTDTRSGLHVRVGNATPGTQTLGDGLTDPKNLFAVVDLSKYYVLGLSYRKDVGLGFRIGLDWGIPKEVATVPARVQLYYARDYINDLVLGQIVDPGMFVIGVGMQ